MSASSHGATSSARPGTRTWTDANRPFDAAVMMLTATGELPDDLRATPQPGFARPIDNSASRSPTRTAQRHRLVINSNCHGTGAISVPRFLGKCHRFRDPTAVESH